MMVWLSLNHIHVFSIKSTREHKFKIVINSFGPCILKAHNSCDETSFKEIVPNRSCLSKLYLRMFMYSFWKQNMRHIL